MTRKLALFGLLLGAAAPVLGSASSARAEAAKGEPIILGAHLDVAKQASYYSLGQKEAIEVFVNRLNANGGINGRPVRVLYEDDELNPVTAAAKVEKLIGQGALFIFSISGSNTGLAAQAKGEEHKISNGGSNTAERLTTNPPKRYYFRFGMRDSVAAAATAAFLKRKFKSPKVAVVRDGTETGLLISDAYIKALKEAGLSVVAVEQISPGSADVTAQALRAKSASPDAVVVTGASIPDLANYVKAHKLIGNAAPMMGSYVFSAPGFIRLVGAAGDGFIMSDVVDPDRKEFKEIEEILVKALGPKARNAGFMVQTWEFVRFVTDGLKRSGPDREKLRDALEATRDWPTALGPPGTKVDFTANRHDLVYSENDVVFRELRNGQFGPGIYLK